MSAAAAREVPADPWPSRFVVAPTGGDRVVVHDMLTAEVSEHASERLAFVMIGGARQAERDRMAADFERGGKSAMDEGHEHRLNLLVARRVQSYGHARARVAGVRS